MVETAQEEKEGEGAEKGNVWHHRGREKYNWETAKGNRKQVREQKAVIRGAKGEDGD